MSATDTRNVLVCTACTAATTNDDWTWLDLYCDTPEESVAEYDRVTATAATLKDDQNEAHTPYGYWDCYVCGSTFCGATGHLWSVAD